MQTFLPYPDFEETAWALDDRRLGKQRVEALQILRALTRPVYGWKHHPAVLMWKGHEEALGAYAGAICREWCRRGHADTCEVKIMTELGETGVAVPPRSQADLAASGALPPWLGDDAVHRSHRSALLRKDPEWYRPRFGDEPDDLEYAWPVRKQTAR
ncbi:MAG TPA: MSMEG_6728 family protein [Solirubrobacterales bacterium]|nr:MSMEG_6728 family protein [Solirubrobacterales bacterium]